MKYSKAFEKYWMNADNCVCLGLDLWMKNKIKHIAYRAWRNGRSYQDKIRTEGGCS